jgi:DNA repair exonuclease SbcCD ATPase subunit
MKIINFKAENFKKLVAVEITPDGNVVQITGKNGAGKTSILDAIMAALGGKSVVQSKPIRKGQAHASVELDLGDMIVKRFFKEKEGEIESTLEVRNKEGARFPSPQKMLDELVGRLSFDPLEFMRQKPAEQYVTLRDLAGLDFSKLDAKRQAAYDRRTDYGREYRSVAAQRDAAVHTFDPDGAKAEVSTAELILEFNEATTFNRGIDDAKSRLSEIDTLVQRRQDEIAQLEQQIADKREEINRHNARRPNIEAIANQQPRDLAAIQAKLQTSEADNRNARNYQAYETLVKRSTEIEQLGRKCADEIKAVDEEKAAMISASKMPVPGLEFGDGVVLFNGIPLDQASAAEQLKVSVAMAMAMNPQLRVLRITDGSLLDGDSLKALEAMAVDSDYQVWIERVDESGQVGIVIEDGHIKQNQAAA